MKIILLRLYLHTPHQWSEVTLNTQLDKKLDKLSKKSSKKSKYQFEV